MTKKSNAYIGQGLRNGVRVMKVGKSNDVERRRDQIDIVIERVASCITESVAFEFETYLRKFVVRQGAVRYGNTKDWFHFDKQIYDRLIQFFDKTQLSRLAEMTEDEEIRLFQAKYYDLLKEEYIILEGEMRYLKQQNEELRAAIPIFRDENIRLKAQYAAMEKFADELRAQLERERQRNKLLIERERTRIQAQLEQERTRIQAQLEQERTRIQAQLEQERTRIQAQLEQAHTQGQAQLEQLLREIERFAGRLESLDEDE